ncbi:hypothetical protein HUW51_10095 [Adhaeribacter swui]|uniref:GLPGLI family protein n=1 Tax=Adhaeribacter swui TaxID=2086471 RepID=A0A7G7G7D3_9BACT|nr:hypothetical protein [Adhaeribacter swui]QNF33067.1 hypothetical protein HUW51_10095 [Adhaeribacter swui]
MKALTCVFYSVFFKFLIFHSAFAQNQTNTADTLNLLTAKNNVTNAYTTSLDNDLHLYNGKEYLSYDKYYLKGHQFYKSSEEQEGAVYYEGHLYTKISLLYDVVLDQIVVSEPNGSLQFKLENQKINYFQVHDHVFIRLNADTLSTSAIRTGFYDLLVDGETQVLAKRIKRIFEDVTPRGMEGEFVIEDKFLIRKNTRYYPVTKKKSVIKVLQNNKKELLKYSRTQHLKFNKEMREASLVKLVQYYNSLPTLQ